VEQGFADQSWLAFRVDLIQESSIQNKRSMSVNTRRIERALLAKGLVATVTYRQAVKGSADDAEGYYSQQARGAKYRDLWLREAWLSGWLGYSAAEVLNHLGLIREFYTNEGEFTRVDFTGIYLNSYGNPNV
jgi:hypothetical protein